MSTLLETSASQLAVLSGEAISSGPAILVEEDILYEVPGLDRLEIDEIQAFMYALGAPRGSIESLGILLTRDIRPYIPQAPKHGTMVTAHQEYNGVHYGPFIALGISQHPNQERLNFGLRHEIRHVFQPDHEIGASHTNTQLGALATGLAVEVGGMISIFQSGEPRLAVGLASVALVGASYGAAQVSGRTIHRLRRRERDANQFARANSDFNPIRLGILDSRLGPALL